MPNAALGTGEGALWLKVYGSLEAASRQRYERGPSLYVTGHRVLGVSVHLAIEYRDENNNVETLSAFPKGFFENLESELNRSEDRDPGNNFMVGVLPPPENVAPGDCFRTLQDVDDQYNDLAPYDLSPYFDRGAYNSNSYVRGLIEATGGRTAVDFDAYYGDSRPLPISKYPRVLNPP